MTACVSWSLLDVQDRAWSKRFDTEGLGSKVELDYGVSVFFESDGGSFANPDDYNCEIGYRVQGKNQLYAE